MSVLCYSARFIQPFAQVLSGYESFDRALLGELNAFDPSSRIPMALAHQLAVQQVRMVGDADLGLKAAQITPPGRAGPLEYAMNSAPTMREALDVGARFARLFCDGLRILVEVEGPRVKVRMHSSVPAPRIIPDYAMAIWYRHQARAGLGTGARLDCHFEHARPTGTQEYDRVFETAALRFNSPFYGFVFDRDYLDAPLPASDPALHVVLCEHVSRSLSQLHYRPSLADNVRQLALKELLNGNPTVAAAARSLHMSTRTLASRLEREGTTFSALLDQMRHELALTYLRDPSISLSEISYRLGFSHVEGFHRAFKRWTGEAPAGYRRKRQTPVPPPPGTAPVGSSSDPVEAGS